MARVRVYELAKEFGIPHQEVVTKVRGLGIDVKNHMSSIELEDVQRLKRALEKERTENRETKRLSSTVIRRRSRSKGPAAPKRAPAAAADESPAEARPTAVAQAPSAPAVVASAVAEEPPAAEAPVAVEAAPSDAAEAAPSASAEPTSVDSTAAPSADAGAPSAPADEAASASSAEPAPSEPSASAPSAEPTGDADADTSGDAAATSEAAPSASSEASAAPIAEAPSASPADDAAAATAPTATVIDEPAAIAEPEKGPTPRGPARRVEVSGDALKRTDGPGRAPAGPDDGDHKDDEDKPAVRYAPGFEPGGKYSLRPPGRYGRPQGPVRGSTGEALSAAEAAKMMAPAKPKVVITDLDARRRGPRREVSRADLFRNRGFRGQRGRGRKKQSGGKKGKKTEITTPAEHKRVIRVETAIAVGDVARQMGVKATEVLKRLWAMGMTNVMINQAIDVETASLLASEFGYEVEDVAFKEEQVLHAVDDSPEDLEPRAPVITVMGHVDHGKTSLLDKIRETDVVRGEAGGITQHIGAYRVDTPQGDLVFLDTPGHEAFTAMRARGAQCTDIVVLVVAADDGVMPQTQEAIDHAKDAGVPIIVAVNKCDLPDANPDRVKTELAERNLIPEEWGGETQFVNVSAMTGDGVDDLLESLSVQAEILELEANATKPAVGTVVEAKLDKARGAMCTVLVQEGTLRVGDTVVTGQFMGKVRAMLDHRGTQLKEAGPSTPVEILGLGGVPDAGDTLNAVTDEKAARTLTEHRQQSARKRELAGQSAGKTYEELLEQIKSGESRELKALVKADVQGSAQAVKDSLTKLGTPKVSVNVISAGVGGITETDVNLAKAAGAVVLGFNVRAAGKASQLAEREGVNIVTYDVIYEMLDDVTEMMKGLLPKDRREKVTGRAEVRQTFTIPKIGVVAGCAVIDGKVTRGSLLRLVRDNVKLFDGRIGTLKRFKDDVRSVDKGYECGLSIEGKNDIQVGDIIEAYDVEEVAASLT